MVKTAQWIKNFCQKGVARPQGSVPECQCAQVGLLGHLQLTLGTVQLGKGDQRGAQVVAVRLMGALGDDQGLPGNNSGLRIIPTLLEQKALFVQLLPFIVLSPCG